MAHLLHLEYRRRGQRRTPRLSLEGNKPMADFAPTHPGEILKTEFLDPLGISQYRIAKAIDVPPRRINEIVHGKRAISADTGLRLSRALGLSDMFWINMQAHYDAEIAREHIGTELATIERIA